MSLTITAPAARLVKVAHRPSGHWSSVTFEVWVGDRRIGWVHDEKGWTGTRFTARRWTAVHREDGDTAARWRGDMISTSRKGAVDALVAQAGAW